MIPPLLYSIPLVLLLLAYIVRIILRPRGKRLFVIHHSVAESLNSLFGPNKIPVIGLVASIVVVYFALPSVFVPVLMMYGMLGSFFFLSLILFRDVVVTDQGFTRLFAFAQWKNYVHAQEHNGEVLLEGRGAKKAYVLLLPKNRLQREKIIELANNTEYSFSPYDALSMIVMFAFVILAAICITAFFVLYSSEQAVSGFI